MSDLVAQALLPAAPALVPALLPRRRAEMSLGTAGTSACATSDGVSDAA